MAVAAQEPIKITIKRQDITENDIRMVAIHLVLLKCNEGNIAVFPDHKLLQSHTREDDNFISLTIYDYMIKLLSQRVGKGAMIRSWNDWTNKPNALTWEDLHNITYRDQLDPFNALNSIDNKLRWINYNRALGDRKRPRVQKKYAALLIERQEAINLIKRRDQVWGQLVREHKQIKEFDEYLNYRGVGNSSLNSAR